MTAVALLIAGCASAALVGTHAAGAATTPSITVSPTALDFGDVQLGTTGTGQTVTVTNTGTAAVKLSGSYVTSGPFKVTQLCRGVTLAPGASCPMTISFAPTKAGAAKGFTAGMWSGVPFTVQLKGNDTQQFLISPTSFDFGNVPLGSHAPQQIVNVTNIGTTSVVMSGAGGGAGQFGGSQDCQGQTIAPGATCHMYYQFSPTFLGVATGSTGGDWNGQNFAFTFKGSGTPRFRISPTAFDFGEVPVGTTAPQQLVTITNLGTTPVVMSGAGGGAGQFGGSQDCQGLTIAPGASCHMYYAFHPTAAGAATGSTGGNWNGQTFAFTFKGTGISGARTKRFLISPTAFDFGDVPLGSPAPQQLVTITNVGTTPVVMSGAGGGAGQFGGSQDCQGLTIAAGASCHMYYQLTPTALGALTGSTGGNWNGQTFAFTFKGTGAPRFLISPIAFDFGDVTLGTTSPQQLVNITNLGTTSIVMSGAGGGAGQFGGSQDCQGLTIAAGAGCHMYYAFHPTAAGAATGSTGGNWNGQNFAFTFKGTGPSDLLVSPVGLAFPKTAVGHTSVQQTVAVRNVSGHALSLSIVNAPVPAGFVSTNNCPASLPTGAACAYRISFQPKVKGAVHAVVKATINGQVMSVAVTGTGT